MINEGFSELLDGVARLKKLNILHLDFSKTHFSATDLQAFTKCLSGLKDLTELELRTAKDRDNGIDNDSLKEFGNCLKALTELTLLQIKFGLLADTDHQGLKILIDGIKPLTKLKILHFNIDEAPNFKDETLIYLAKNLKFLTELTELRIRLNECKISETGIRALSLIFPILNQLTFVMLNFERCQSIKSAALDVLYTNLAKISTLETLHIILSHCDFGTLVDTDSDLLPQSSLKRFYLSLADSNIKMPNPAGLCNIIMGMSNLIDLSISFARTKGFDERAIESLAWGWLKLGFLESINLDFESSGMIDDKSM